MRSQKSNPKTQPPPKSNPKTQPTYIRVGANIQIIRIVRIILIVQSE